MIFDIITNKKFQAIIKELLLRKLNISLTFITQSYFSVLNSKRSHIEFYKLANKENS